MGWLWGGNSSPRGPRSVSEETVQNATPVPSAQSSSDKDLLDSATHQLLRQDTSTSRADAEVGKSRELAKFSGDQSGELITDEDLFEATMSCRERFDRAFYCQGLGGQFNQVYRYGGLRDCSESWSDFWFCMKIKNNGDAMRRQKIQQRFKEREKQKYKIGPSSEDVWTARTVKVQKAFDSDPDDAPLDD